MGTFTYPTSSELTTIAQDKMPRLTADRPIFDIFPIRTVDSHLLRWEQKDNYVGLQQIRGLNGDPARVKRIGGKVYQMEPGVYGEFIRIDEQELTTRRQWGSYNQPISIDDLVMEAQDQLLGRQIDRIEQVLWALITPSVSTGGGGSTVTGTFSVLGPDGSILQADAYTLQSYGAAVAWATVATATPIADFRGIKLLSRGKSVSFGAGCIAYANQVTVNNLLSNTNTNDLGGRRLSGLAPVNNLADVNRILLGEDLPAVQVYDDGYLDDNGSFQLFIPNSRVVVVGKRPAGQTVGEYRMTRNVNNPGMAPGMYMKVIDRGEDEVPRSIEVHQGHNGGPVLYFPSAIVVLGV